MKVIEFYVNDEFKKTAKLYCDSVYFRKSDGSILCLRSFHYPSFIKSVEWVFNCSYVKKIYDLERS